MKRDVMLLKKNKCWSEAIKKGGTALRENIYLYIADFLLIKMLF